MKDYDKSCSELAKSVQKALDNHYLNTLTTFPEYCLCWGLQAVLDKFTAELEKKGEVTQ